MKLTEKQLKQCESSTWNFTDLKALFLNCTLKRSPELSHTEGLINIARAIMEKNGVSVKLLRPVDYNIAYGVYPDMVKHGWVKDEWPDIYTMVTAANILVITSPIWLGEKSSVCSCRHWIKTPVKSLILTVDLRLLTHWHRSFQDGNVNACRSTESNVLSKRLTLRRSR